ncbi:MAG: hypothetical protein Q7S48_02310 [bacterium]|nr:hypothetical protein [bacterium]
MAVLKAIRDADNNTCAAAQRVLDMQTATMSHEALAEIASIASELLPDLRRELAVAQKPTARDHAIN